jgi:hypothetical protein
VQHPNNNVSEGVHGISSWDMWCCGRGRAVCLEGVVQPERVCRWLPRPWIPAERGADLLAGLAMLHHATLSNNLDPPSLLFMLPCLCPPPSPPSVLRC